MRLVIDEASSNILLGLVQVRDRSRMRPLIEVGINRDEPECWPIAINLVEIDRHVFLTRKAAREFAELLISAADAAEVQCSRCSNVEDSKVHDRSSSQWLHDYDEMAI